MGSSSWRRRSTVFVNIKLVFDNYINKTLVYSRNDRLSNECLFKLKPRKKSWFTLLDDLIRLRKHKTRLRQRKCFWDNWEWTASRLALSLHLWSFIMINLSHIYFYKVIKLNNNNKYLIDIMCTFIIII